MKIRLNNKGETFIETLLAIMIIAIVSVGFAVVISSTTKVSRKVREDRVAFNEETKVSVSGWNVKIDNIAYIDPNLRFYSDDKGELYYYEYE